LLQAAGIADRFALIYGGDSLSAKKPNPIQLRAAMDRTGIAATATVMVGDSRNDWRAADAAGIAFVWASYGYTGEIANRIPRPPHAIGRFDELPEVLGQLDQPG
jgi:phosphoglycolate phosphatase